MGLEVVMLGALLLLAACGVRGVDTDKGAVGDTGSTATDRPRGTPERPVTRAPKRTMWKASTT
jgi:hypothetical protein